MDNDQKRTYLYNAMWLTILTIMELGINHLTMEKSIQVLLLLAFAITKMILVATIYMHLRYETKMLRRILFIPIPAAILFGWALIYDLPFRWAI